MNSSYDHSLYEAKIYQAWLDKNLFDPDTTTELVRKAQNSASQSVPRAKKHFTITMPPPNANDPLHVGHAMFVALEDAMTRYHRMRGDDTLWQPGADHAGIETQFVFEKKLAKQGQSRFNFDRETLYQKVWDYVQENAGVAKNQLQKIGASADWSRFKFTLDQDIVKTVLNTFFRLNDAGLIYRAQKLVNYCPKCGTAFSDLEIDHVEQKTPLYYIKYGPFVLATTRPETIFGDVAVAVHPDDKRYQKYIGQEIEVETPNGKFKVKVVADEYVDPEFGTGAVKITPAHDHNDYEVWQRHLEEIGRDDDGLKQVIGFDGKMNALAGKYAGLKAGPAREAVVTDMQEMGLIDHIDENYTNISNRCYRCGQIIEPLPLTQIFIKVKPLVEPVLKKIEAGEVKVLGSGHDKILVNWLNNLRDWNISRQIVWGIRQPVWYDAGKNPTLTVVFLNKKGERITGELKSLIESGYPLNEIKKGLQNLVAPQQAIFEISAEEPGSNYLQETDTFDTWFSSSQWPFATLQNSKPGDFERFYPTTVMETGYDILPFWVMRMLMMGLFATGELPFSTVYLHGLIRDQKGQKMSKSKGNVVNPIEMVDKYGADALRLALMIRSTPGLDKSVGEGDFRAMRNLTNKIWNAGRFLLMQSENEAKNLGVGVGAKTETEGGAKVEGGGGAKTETEAKTEAGVGSVSQADAEVRQKMNVILAEITQNLENYQLGLAVESLYNYFWHYYCDQLIEWQKNGQISFKVLKQAFAVFLKLWQPFAPFVTQAVWQEIISLYPDENQPHDLIVAPWPEKI